MTQPGTDGRCSDTHVVAFPTVDRCQTHWYFEVHFFQADITRNYAYIHWQSVIVTVMSYM